VYTPNTTLSRLEGIARKYESRPVAVWSTIMVACYATGLDRIARELRPPTRMFLDKPWIVQWVWSDLPARVRRYDEMLRAGWPEVTPGSQPVTNELVQQVLAFYEVEFGQDSLADRILPWVAARFSRRARQIDRAAARATRAGFGHVHHPRAARVAELPPDIAVELGRRVEKSAPYYEAWNLIDDYGAIENVLESQANAIARWADLERIDLMPLGVLEVADAVENYRFPEPEGGRDQGEIVYRFRDGWTVQSLQTPEQLAEEGEAMQHCVGGDDYCHLVEEGDVIIYSLRDPGGNPHVTMEYGVQEERFQQIEGKQNSTPRAEYQARVQEFILNVYGGEPTAMLMAGADPRDLDLRNASLDGMNLSEADLSDQDLRGVELESANLNHVNFDGADLRNAKLSYASLAGTTFRGARLDGANLYHALSDSSPAARASRAVDFTEASMVKVKAMSAGLERSRFVGADLSGASFSGANVARSDFRDADLRGADFSGSQITDSDFRGADYRGADFTNAVGARTMGRA
jgi:uncharacterized protein YjbI with pentapeptide repeats